jgi:hypothetical protein
MSYTKLTTELFIEKARTVHGDKYDYSKVVYTGSKDNVKIICPTHGEFEQKASSHLHRNGCPACAVSKRKTTKDEFIEKSTKAHNGKYDYSKVVYTRSRDKVTIICPRHGEFEQLPKDHMRGIGCTRCAKRGTGIAMQDMVEEKIKNKHGDHFSFERFEYTGTTNKATFICTKTNRSFEMKPVLLAGEKGRTRCPICYPNRGGGVYSEIGFSRHPEIADAAGVLYLLAFEDHTTDERFLKVGITRNWRTGRKYQYELDNITVKVLELKEMRMIDAFRLEQQIIDVLRNKRFEPTNKFRGHTECLMYETLEDIQRMIQ